MYTDYIRSTPISQDDYDNYPTRCNCQDESSPIDDPYGDNSSLPCMSPLNGMIGYPELHCKNCILCELIKDKPLN